MQHIIIFRFFFHLVHSNLHLHQQSTNTEPSSLTPWQGSRSSMSQNTQMQMLPTSGDMVFKMTSHDLSFDCLSTCLSLRTKKTCQWLRWRLEEGPLGATLTGFPIEEGWQLTSRLFLRILKKQYCHWGLRYGRQNDVPWLFSHWDKEDRTVTEMRRPSWCHTGFPIEEGWQVAFSLGTPRHNNGAVSIQYSQSSVIHDYIYQVQQRTVQNPGFFHFLKVTRLSIWSDVRLTGLDFQWQFWINPRKIYPVANV